MAGHKKARSRNPRPLCKGTLKNGDPCNSYVREDGFCKWHAEQDAVTPENDASPNDESGAEEAAAQADPTADDSPNDDAAPVLDLEPTEEEVELGQAVENVRAQLGRDVSANYELVIDSLLSALRAERDRMVQCPNCQKKHTIVSPDWTARVKALETLLNQGLGKLSDKSKEEDDRAKLKQVTEENIRQLSDDQLAAIAWGTENPEEQHQRHEEWFHSLKPNQRRPTSLDSKGASFR